MEKIKIIELADNHLKDYLILIKKLSKFINCENKKLSINNRKIYVMILENKIIGTGSLFLLEKYHCNNIVLLEDIIIEENKRKKGLGKHLMDFLINEAKKTKCYKIILDCKDENIGFYEKCNFKKNGIHLSLYN